MLLKADNEATAVTCLLQNACSHSFMNSSLCCSIPPIKLTEGSLTESGHDAASPSYGSLRESQLAGRFLDGPSSYREKSSGQIKRWHTQKVRFQSPSSEGSTPGERMQELREQQATTPEQRQQPPRNKDGPSSLSAMLMSSPHTPASTFHDYEYSVEQEDVLSTSLTGLELLQRGLSIDDRPPDASHLSSWSSSGANTYDAIAEPQEEASSSLDHAINNNMSPLPDEEEEVDDSPVFDLDME